MNKNFFVVTSLLAIAIIMAIGLGDALVPLFISFSLAYLLFPLITRIEKKGISRQKAVLLTFTLGFFIFSSLAVLILPKLVNEGKQFFENLPAASAKAINNLEALSLTLGFELDLSKEGITEYVRSHIKSVSTAVIKSASTHLKMAFGSITSWILGLLNLILIPLFFVYVINDFEKISAEFKSFIPPFIRPHLKRYSELANTVLSGYIRGQLMVAFILSLLYSLGLTLVGVKFGMIIGLLAGLISIIPYVGFIVGFGAALAVTLANFELNVMIGLLIVFSVVQLLESFVITPKLVGNKVGLSELATMLALIIGGNLLGLAGMLLAIPTAAIIKALLIELKEDYQNSEFYRAKGLN
jgi:predicted PurR-regulated permease PerM